jgi:hypothetical protein
MSSFTSSSQASHPRPFFKASSIGSLAKVYGVITFVLEHPEDIAVYLRDQERLWEELNDKHPLPPDMLQRFVRSRELLRKSA